MNRALDWLILAGATICLVSGTVQEDGFTFALGALNMAIFWARQIIDAIKDATTELKAVRRQGEPLKVKWMP